MNNLQVLDIAMEQSAIDSNCLPVDFCDKENQVFISEKNKSARKYLALPFYCDLVSYGNNIVASVNKEIASVVRKYINSYPVEHCFETPNLHVLNGELEKNGYGICFMAEYFLPDLKVLRPVHCDYEIRVLEKGEFEDLYMPQWSNALCENRRQRDILAVAAYHDNKIIGLSGASADCEKMWQIGIDVLPDYRRKGIAASLTSTLALEILNRGKVPFYCAAWSNISSVRNAITSGFKPAWVQVTAKPIDFVEKLNQSIL